MKDILVSVILPIYNVELYLNQCIESVVGQTYKNIEIILVDDGTKDSSGLICDEWAQKDSRIIVIHKKNEGLGYARNSGLEIAHGDFVMFVDSDDRIEEQAVEKLINRIWETGSDTVLCNFYRWYSDGRKIEVNCGYTTEVFDGIQVKENVLLEIVGALPNASKDITVYMSVWHGIYSMGLIKENNIRFPSEREYISEDLIFDIDYFRYSKRVAFIPDNLYMYRENENSLSTIYNPMRFHKELVLYMEANRKLSLYFECHEYWLRLTRTFLGRVRSCIMRAVVSKGYKSIDDIKEICKNDIVNETLSKYPYKLNPKKLMIFNFCLERNYYLLICIMAKLVGKNNLRG